LRAETSPTYLWARQKP